MDAQPTLREVLDHVIGFSNYVERNFEKFSAQFAQIDERFKGIDERFKGMDKRFDQIDRRFERIDKRFDESDRKLMDVRNDLAGLISKSDRKVTNLVHILEDKKILTSEEAVRIL